MLKTLGYPLLALAMLSIIGGHWSLLQTVAWAGMILDFSKSTPLVVAIERTISGKSPCRMCHAIEDGRKKEQQIPAALKSEKKSDSFLAAEPSCSALPRSTAFGYPRDPGRFYAARFATPPDHVPIAA